MTVTEAQDRISGLLQDRRGNPKEILTDPDYPPYDPHNIPGVYFLAAHPVRRVPGRWWPETFKIGESGDPYVRLRPVLTNNAADIELLHVIHEPDRSPQARPRGRATGPVRPPGRERRMVLLGRGGRSLHP